ncbi:MAG TPA: GNAT family protein [Steroidobacteraceae bacterium]|nr:GNAT family protein [Steroidobacteraceae bacterium]
MKLLPLESPEVIGVAAGWLAREENYRWLDFGAGRQRVSPALLKVMAQRESHFMRVYTADHDDTPVGIVGLNSVDRGFRTATLWGVAGEKSFRSRGLATFAGSQILTLAFRDLGLHAVNTWVADGNPSLRVVERLHFRPVGRMRQCHYMDGKPYDRLFFDLLATEHREIEHERPRRNG